jgi:signal transduction histidine kinase/DNA-binding response OmpR family regulator
MTYSQPSYRMVNSEQRSDVEAVRLAVLHPVLWGLFGVGGIIIFVGSIRPEPLAMPLAVAVFCLLGTAALGWFLLRYGSVLAAGSAVSVSLLIVAGLMWAMPDGVLVIALPLVVAAAAATLGAFAGLVTAGAATMVVVLAFASSLPALTWSVADLTLLAIWGSTLLVWAASRPLLTVLEWSWESYSQLLVKNQELQVQQQRLLSTVKSLNEAYDRLEHLNNELSRARKAAEEAHKLKSQFAANISHEFRTPLNLIIGFSEVMVTAPETYGGQPLPEAYRADANAIYRSARHLSGLIDDVLELSQIESGRFGLVRRPVSLAEISRDAADTVAPIYNSKRLRLEVGVPDDLPLISADPTRVRQVIVNLLGNAGRFTSEGGVKLKAQVQGNEVAVSVVDTGIGIPLEDLGRVFDDFYQVDRSLSRRFGGTGLGLAICKQLVELQGGTIWVESKLGEGSAFHFTLPLAPNVVTRVPPGDWVIWDRLTEAQGDLPSLAVVSTDQALMRIFERHLDGYRVTSLPDLVAARQTAAGRDAAALLVVAGSPLDAWRQVAELQQEPVQQPVVICSVPSVHGDGADLGAVAYLLKPVSRHEVLRVLGELIPPNGNVLVVDDDPDVVRMLGRMVRSSKLGYHVWRANSGDEALAILRGRRPDIVLLDLIMPGVDGYAVLDMMRQDERLRDVPVVVVTARSGREVTVNADLVVTTRAGGLTVRELMSCLETSLNCLLAHEGGRASEPRRERSGTAAG